MPTLRDEALRNYEPDLLRPDLRNARPWTNGRHVGYAVGFDDALRDYGDWEIVDAIVRITDGQHWRGEGRVYLYPRTDPPIRSTTPIRYFDAGETVKLIIPPRGPFPESWIRNTPPPGCAGSSR